MMPPKTAASAAAKKSQASKERPLTPKSDAEDGEVSEVKPETKTKSKARKGKKAPEKDYKDLPFDVDRGAVPPVDVAFATDGKEAALLDNGQFGQDLRLRAQQPFALLKTIMINEGDFAGSQAIIVAPSKPFPFIDLPLLVRTTIYRYCFAPSGKVYGKLDITQGPVAKGYAAKDRLGLLRISKEIANEARPILYSFTFRFDKSDTLLSFLISAGDKIRDLLTSIEITLYTKAVAAPMMTLLAECKRLQLIHFIGGVGVGQSPSKAAKVFYADAHRFLEVFGAARGEKYVGIDVLAFGKNCLAHKTEEGLVAWNEDEVDEFTAALKERLGDDLNLPKWTCTCASRVPGHVCGQVMLASLSSSSSSSSTTNTMT